MNWQNHWRIYHHESDDDNQQDLRGDREGILRQGDQAMRAEGCQRLALGAGFASVLSGSDW